MKLSGIKKKVKIMSKRLAATCIVSAGVLWGMIAVFVKHCGLSVATQGRIVV